MATCGAPPAYRTLPSHFKASSRTRNAAIRHNGGAMRIRIGSAFGLLPLLIAFAACNPPKTPAMAADSTTAGPGKVDKQAEEQAIREIGRKWEKMFAAHDSAGIAALFADDGYEMPPNAKSMKGPNEVGKGLGEMWRAVKDFNLTFAPSTITIADAGDLAVERGTYKASMTEPKGKKIEDHGNYVTVYKKVDGQWKVLADINASEVPGAM
jgi:uncharacterized protein (TIGR02246 family)